MDSVGDVAGVGTAAQAAEYVADDADAMAYRGTTVMTDLDQAADAVTEILRARITAVLTDRPETPGLMLSGGIDSILVAAVCADLGLQPQTLTVVTDVDGGLEDLRGRDVAARLGFDHHVVDLDPARLAEAAAACIAALGTWELWEITSAIPVQAAFARFAELGVGPVFTGAGSDALFQGGARLAADADAPEALDELRTRVRAKVTANFTRERLIPDYYERLLDDRAEEFVQVFQTAAFWRFAMDTHPTLLWRPGPDGRGYDKAVLRHAAVRLGIPTELAWTVKSPLQVSSGVIGALAQSARTDLAAQPHQLTYEDPRTEPLEHTVVRMFLRGLSEGGR